jgi:hypothetical protein
MRADDSAGQRHLIQQGWRLQLLATLAAALGWWLPWVVHPVGSAALILLGLDLGEFLKFAPHWHPPISEVHWDRGAFFVPPIASQLLLCSLLVERSWGARLLALPLLLFLALVVLPAYPYSWAQLWSPEFRFQTWLALAGLAGLLLLALPRPTGQRGWAALFTLRLLLALVGALLPVWAFWRVSPVLASLYGRPIPPGAGLILSVLGFLLGTAIAFFNLWHIPCIRDKQAGVSSTTD